MKHGTAVIPTSILNAMYASYDGENATATPAAITPTPVANIMVFLPNLFECKVQGVGSLTQQLTTLSSIF